MSTVHLCSTSSFLFLIPSSFCPRMKVRTEVSPELPLKLQAELRTILTRENSFAPLWQHQASVQRKVAVELVQTSLLWQMTWHFVKVYKGRKYLESLKRESRQFLPISLVTSRSLFPSLFKFSTHLRDFSNSLFDLQSPTL